jgi:FAD/FMN-containing dehydrogenase
VAVTLSNPGFSSTEGIHIYTGRFSQVTYDATSGTVVVGTGLIWDNVYEQLQEHNVIVAGGRVTGVSRRRDRFAEVFSISPRNRSALVASYSVAVRLLRSPVALSTNGSPTGYSYKTNQYGLAIDSVVGYNLVLPNGTVTYVTQSTHPDLFFGLKGGFNNFVSHLPKTPPFGSTHRIIGDCYRFHDDGIPTN